MSAEENKAIVRRLIEELNKGNLLWEVWASDCVIHNGSPPPPLVSIQEFRQLVDELTRAFPDYHLVIEDLIAEEDKVVGLYTESGTMKGNFMGMEATGKQYTIPSIEIYRLANGKITEIWMARDIASTLQQLGVVPPPSEGGE
ncbi:MAG: ester cyclase [Candidatus Bipolaricaulia bacterium]